MLGRFTVSALVIGLLMLMSQVLFHSVSSLKSEAIGAEDDQGKVKAEEPVKGPHRGRLLVDGDLKVEVTIFETGVPPQFRLFVYDGEKPLPPEEVGVSIELTRIRGRVDRFDFKPTGEYLACEKIVEEPHSFDVKVEAVWKGRTSSWSYPSYEGRTTISEAAIKAADIAVEAAGPVKLKLKLPVNGRIVPDEDRLVHVSPRFPGIVKEVRKRLGDTVNQGDLLAVVESNVNLNHYEVRSQLSGTVVKKDATVGEFVSERDPIYVIADLRSVWVDLDIYRKDYSKIRVGQTLTLHASSDVPEVTTKVSYISPFGTETTQSMLARAVIANPSGTILPGLFVTGALLLEEADVPVAVRADAIQKFRDWDVVFAQDGSTFEIVPLELGRSDGEWVEVLGGLEAGQIYVAKNSFIVKADILKSGASHDH